MWTLPSGSKHAGQTVHSIGYARAASFTPASSTDEIVLLDALGTEIDRVAYEDGASFPNPDGASTALLSPDLDNNAGPSWFISISPLPGSAGDFGSPGTLSRSSLSSTSFSVRVSAGYMRRQISAHRASSGSGNCTPDS